MMDSGSAYSYFGEANKHKTDSNFRNIYEYVDFLISEMFGVNMKLKK
jgi:hypothetical protein